MIPHVASSNHHSLRARPSVRELVIHAALMTCALVSIATTIGIVATLFNETVAFFSQVSFLKFIGDTEWTPLFADKHFGIWALVSGTVLTSTIGMLVAIPPALLSAIYLSEFAPRRVRLAIKPGLEILAGVPTIVFGYFALSWLTPLLQNFLPQLPGFNALAAGIMIGIMIIPIVASISEDALYAVPNSLREGALALGADKLSTIFKVVLPAASSGIGASILLGLSRAVGETMIAAVAAGQQPTFTLNPTASVQTMTAYIVQVSQGDTPAGTLEYQTIFAVGMCLFLLTFSLNLIGSRLARRTTDGGAA